jgi:hypothetical protein
MFCPLRDKSLPKKLAITHARCHKTMDFIDEYLKARPLQGALRNNVHAFALLSARRAR